jgi:hypothetical protein
MKMIVKKSIPLLISLALFNSIAIKAQEASDTHKDSLKQIVDKYYSLNLKIFKQGSTKADVDDLFNLFTEDFTYVHPKYGGEYSRTDIYEGYLNNQKNGNYNGSLVDIKVRNIIVGLNGLATERVYLQKVESGKLEEVDPGMTLFEFRNGKISKIFEYW